MGMSSWQEFHTRTRHLIPISRISRGYNLKSDFLKESDFGIFFLIPTFFCLYQFFIVVLFVCL
jgi:hypothetical protein